VRAGEAFTPRQRDEITRALEAAEAESDLAFSVYVGATEGESRAYAERLHTELGEQATRAVLVLVDPAARQVEIVTGSDAARRLDDRACTLAAFAMTSTFAAGDLTGGILHGIAQLASNARQPRTLHADTP
jgi:uncharacterized membrane protein YgcG